MHADEGALARLDLTRPAPEQPHLGRVLARSDVGVEGAAARDGVVEAVEDVKAGVEDLGGFPLARSYEGVAAAHLVVMDAGEVGGDAAAGLCPFACLLVRL